MREILFRGRMQGAPEWVFGCYYKQSEFYGDEMEDHIIITSCEDLSYDQALQFHAVEPKTVGQFTGLTDKNGKKIFEGDIIQYSIEEDQAFFVGAVKFGEFNPDGGALHNTNVGFYVVLFDQEGKRTYMRKDIGFWVKFRKIEVIGNIHDNPNYWRDNNE